MDRLTTKSRLVAPSSRADDFKKMRPLLVIDALS
jgi:hypothetical protein